MVASPTGLGPENDCAGEGQEQLQATDPSSRERGRPISTNPQLFDSNKNLVASPRWVLYSKTDWPTDRRSSYKTQTQLLDIREAVKTEPKRMKHKNIQF
jgi:hypothetical protein